MDMALQCQKQFTSRSEVELQQTYIQTYIIQIYSGITHNDRVLNRELYTQRLQKGPEEWREIFMKQYVDKHR